MRSTLALCSGGGARRRLLVHSLDSVKLGMGFVTARKTELLPRERRLDALENALYLRSLLIAFGENPLRDIASSLRVR